MVNFNVLVFLDLYEIKIEKVKFNFPSLTNAQYVNLHMNMDSAIVWNVFFHCRYYLECCHFQFPCHKFGTPLPRTTRIHNTLYAIYPMLKIR